MPPLYARSLLQLVGRLFGSSVGPKFLDVKVLFS